jgi:Glycine zipper
MKRFLSIFSIAAVMAACNSDQDKIMAESARLKSYQDSVRLAADTAGLAEYQAWKMQGELNNTADPYATTAGVAAAAAPAVRTTARSTSSRSYSGSSRSTGRSTGSSSGSGTVAQAPAKKGWSKAAKGAVVGGVVGAGAGAIINKKNRGVGAVIGGVLGAGAGYGVGRGMDKRDGRY